MIIGDLERAGPARSYGNGACQKYGMRLAASFVDAGLSARTPSGGVFGDRVGRGLGGGISLPILPGWQGGFEPRGWGECLGAFDARCFYRRRVQGVFDMVLIIIIFKANHSSPYILLCSEWSAVDQ